MHARVKGASVGRCLGLRVWVSGWGRIDFHTMVPFDLIILGNQV